jgi:hypothetical protein
VLPLAFAPRAPDVTVYLREGGDRAYALLPTDLRPERAAPLLARLGAGRLVAGSAALEAGLDVARLSDARDEVLRGGARPRASTAGARP